MAISINRVLLVGRVGADPETRGRDDGITVMRVATSESWKDRSTGERQERTQWHLVVIFAEPAAKFVAQYVKKGDTVLVEGTIENRKYEKDGAERYITEIVVRPYNGQVQLQSKGSSEREPDTETRERREREDRDTSRSRPSHDHDIDDDIPF